MAIDRNYLTFLNQEIKAFAKSNEDDPINYAYLLKCVIEYQKLILQIQNQQIKKINLQTRHIKRMYSGNEPMLRDLIEKTLELSSLTHENLEIIGVVS